MKKNRKGEREWDNSFTFYLFSYLQKKRDFGGEGEKKERNDRERDFGGQGEWEERERKRYGFKMWRRLSEMPMLRRKNEQGCQYGGERLCGDANMEEREWDVVLAWICILK